MQAAAQAQVTTRAAELGRRGALAIWPSRLNQPVIQDAKMPCLPPSFADLGLEDVNHFSGD